ncbi:MAG: alpha/beta hydrolase, partial [Pseudomonadota bacterium]
ELEKYFRSIYAPFGPVSDEQWRDMTLTSARRRGDGRVTPHYDPRITDQFKLAHDDYALWVAYDAIEVPTLLLRGGQSDLLLQDLAEEMTKRGPKAVLRVDPNCGHAPALNNALQTAWIIDFLT